MTRPELPYELHPECCWPYNPAKVSEYVELLRRGSAPPPITLCAGKLLDGVHRLEAWIQVYGNASQVPRRELDASIDPAAFVYKEHQGTRGLSFAELAEVVRVRMARTGKSLDECVAVVSDRNRQMIKNIVHRLDNPNAPTKARRQVLRPPQGPAEKPHYIPEGHELGGVSRLTDAEGNTRGEWSKTRVAGADEPPVPIPESFLLDKASVMRRGDGSTVVEWSSYKRDAVSKWEAIKEAVAEHVREYVRPVALSTPPSATDADRLVVYPLGDPHIGMMAWGNEVGENFDLKMAERELCECMAQLVLRSPSSEEAIICNLGDFWHAQDDSQRTPKSGNKLDVDGRAGKVGSVGLSILRTLVDAALSKHQRVRVRSIPGNHDPQSAFWIPLYLQAAYRNEPRVTVEEGFAPYQYDVFGNVLLGWAHGDGAKLETLGEIMATDEPEKWGKAAFRYWNTGHVHHWSQKELRGCVVDTHRTLAGRDAWHHHSGYRSGRALKAVTYHRLYGLDSVAIVGIERVRAAFSA